MKRLIDTITVNNPEVEYYIVRALENTDVKSGESEFEVVSFPYGDRECKARKLEIYKVENVPAETPKTGF